MSKCQFLEGPCLKCSSSYPLSLSGGHSRPLIPPRAEPATPLLLFCKVFYVAARLHGSFSAVPSPGGCSQASPRLFFVESGRLYLYSVTTFMEGSNLPCSMDPNIVPPRSSACEGWKEGTEEVLEPQVRVLWSFLLFYYGATTASSPSLQATPHHYHCGFCLFSHQNQSNL